MLGSRAQRSAFRTLRGVDGARRTQEGCVGRFDRHGAPHDRRHGGPAAGQAPDHRPLPRRGHRARGRGLQLPAGRGRGHEHRRRLRDVQLGARLRRFRDAARHGHPAPRSLARRHGARHGRPGLGGRRRRGRLAAPDPAPPARSPGRAGLAGDRRHRARVHRVQRQLRGGVEEGLSRPRPRQPLQRRLLDAGHRPCGAADPSHPQLDDRGGHEGRELQGRVQLRSARDQLPLRRRPGHRRRPRDLQDRGQGDRRPGGRVDHLHGEVRRARGQQLPHPLLAPARGRRQRVRRRRADLQPLRGRAARRACAT